LDAALAARLAIAGPVDRRLLHAWRLLSASGGAVGVAALAGEVGWSRRHLATLFRREFGLPPKTVGRLLRFQRAYATLGQGLAGTPVTLGHEPAGGPLPGRPRAPDEATVPGWAELAVRCGYYDQSHLIRDFREFAGRTPARGRRPGSHSSNPG
ncbi:helix-turn-helix domain-containing protein, partial [Micromonospora sp. NPDC003776]